MLPGRLAIPSEPRTGLREIRQFVRCADPAQYAIAMRKAAKTCDDCRVSSSIIETAAVAIGLIRRSFVAQRLEQRHGMSLQSHIFSMFQRHVGKHTLERRKLAVKTFL